MAGLGDPVGRLIETIDDLAAVLYPFRKGQVARAAFDTETTEVRDGRFTAFGTDVRMAGFSVSYGDVDFYVCLRHAHYQEHPKALSREALLRRRPRKDEKPWVLSAAEWADLLDAEAEVPIPNLNMSLALELLAGALAREETRWVLHNAKFDFGMLRADGIEPPVGRFDDTQIMSVFTDERPLDAWDDRLEVEWEGEVSKGGYLHQGHGLKHLGEHYLGRHPDEQDLLLEARKVLKCDSYAHLPLRNIVAPYACQDTRLTLQLAEHIEGRETWRDQRVQARYDTEIRLLPRVLEWEAGGFRKDTELAERLRAEAEAELLRIETETCAAAGMQLPLTSPPRLAEALYEDLAVPRYRGKSDTRQATLKHIRARALRDGDDRTARVIDGILAHRAKSKEVSSFFRPLAEAPGDRVHCVISQIGARTGRMAASKPNLQQSKKDGPMREILIPDEGHVLLFWDFSQIEMRIAAHYTVAIPEVFEYLFTWQCNNWRHGKCKGRPPHGKMGDRDSCRGIIHTGWRGPSYSYRPPTMGLYDGFMGGPDFDPHQRMFEVCQANGLTHIDRKKAKGANFAILYGAGVPKLADTLDSTEDEARKLFNFFWDEAYAELGRVKTFVGERLRQVGADLRWNGQSYVTTLGGRRYYLESSHKALNYIVQGSAREVFGDASLEVCEYFEHEAPEYRYVLPVHDEIIAQVPRDCLDAGVVDQVSRIMVEAGARLGCQVPMHVDPKISEHSWGRKESFHG